MKDKKKLDRMTQAIENQARSNYAISFELLRIRRLIATLLLKEHSGDLTPKQDKFVKDMVTDPREYEGPPDYSEAEGGPPK